MKIKYIDAHCHPNLGALKKDETDIVSSMKEEGVLGIVVGVDKKTSKESVELAEKHDHLYATVGLHPNDTPEETFDKEFFSELIKSPKVVGIGECGLDFYRLQSTDNSGQQKEKERQWREFKLQAEFALKHDLPLMIHCRPSKNSMDAYEDILTYLETLDVGHQALTDETQGDGVEMKTKNLDVGHQALRGNMHFFVGNLEVAKRFWNIGFSTSFTGVLTFTKDYDQVVRECPENLYLSETDAPFATPVPHRGKRNEPNYVKHVVEAIARIRGEDEEKVRAQTLKNAAQIFEIKI